MHESYFIFSKKHLAILTAVIVVLLVVIIVLAVVLSKDDDDDEKTTPTPTPTAHPLAAEHYSKAAVATDSYVSVLFFHWRMFVIMADH